MRFLFLCLLLFCSCRRLELERRYVDRSSLASTFVGSPDPMQKMPPTGEQLWVYWNIPVALVQEQLTLTVKVVFRNLEEEKIAYPVARSRGHYVYSLLDDDYRKKDIDDFSSFTEVSVESA